MSSIVRRASSKLMYMLARALDPAAVANSSAFYAKLDAAGIARLFARDSDGGVSQLSPRGPSLTTDFFDDFINTLVSTSTVAGTGANVYGSALNANNPGTVTSSATVAGADGANVSSGGSSSVFFGGGLAMFECVQNIPTLSDAANRFLVRVGAHDGGTATDVTDGVYLEYDLAAHGDQNYRLCASNNSVRTKVDTGIAAVAGANRRIIITVNAAGTLVSATIDGVASANTVGANIPVTAARNMPACRTSIQKTLGAASRNVIHDYYRFVQYFTAAR